MTILQDTNNFLLKVFSARTVVLRTVLSNGHAPLNQGNALESIHG